MELFNFRDNCRLCLKTHTGFMKNIFTHCVEGYEDTLVQNIFALFKVELDLHKDYPQFICRKCLTEVENVLLFKEDLQRNQEFLLGLFTAAYPNYIEKNPQRIHYSKQPGTKLKSVAVNTDLEIDCKDLGDSECVRVPVNFLRQFSPKVILQTADGASSNKLPEIKNEITSDDSLIINPYITVNNCKYCSKVFGSQALVNTHCKEVHKNKGQEKKYETRKGTPGMQKKVKTSRNVSLTNLPKLLVEHITSPEMDLQNNNAGIEEKLRDRPSGQQVDNTFSTEPVSQEKQALFLQNFNLIAKQEAAFIKTKQKSLKRLMNRHIFHKQIVTNTRKSKPSEPKKGKNKLVGKHSSVKGQQRTAQQEIVCRSIQFLNRYGWRNLKSLSRRGTPISPDQSINMHYTNKATKPISKKIVSKTNKERSVLKEEGRLQSLDNFDQSHELPLPDIKVKTSDSMESDYNRSLKTPLTFATDKSGRCSISSFRSKPVLEESPTTSSTFNRNYLDSFSDVSTKLDISIKSELPSPKGKVDKTKDYRVISSRSFYDKSKDNVTTRRVMSTSLRDIGCRKTYITNDLEAKKEQLERSSVKYKGFSESSVDDKFKQHNFEVTEKKPDISCSSADAILDGINLRRGRGRPRKIDILSKIENVDLGGCSQSSILSTPKKMGRPAIKRNIKDELSTVSSSCKLIEKEKSVSGNISANNSKMLRFNNGTNKIVANGRGQRNPGRSKKNIDFENISSSPATINTAFGSLENKVFILTEPSLLDGTRSQLTYFNSRSIKNEEVSTLQDLNDRYEKSDNIGLRLKLRKTATRENLNSLKYDTQELDENFQIKADTIQELMNTHNDVPDNDERSIKHENEISNNNLFISSTSLGNGELTSEKVVNIALKDEEVQMLVFTRDETAHVDNDNISKYVKFKPRSLNSEQSFLVSEPKNRFSLDENSSFSSVKQFNHSQMCLPPYKDKKEFSVKQTQEMFSNLITNNGSPSSTLVNSKTTPVKRRGRPPTKFSPSLYTVNRLKSAAKVLKGSINESYVELTVPRKRSVTHPKKCAIDLFNAVKKRGRSQKSDKSKNISALLGKNGSPNKLQRQSQKEQYGSKINYSDPKRLKK